MNRPASQATYEPPRHDLLIGLRRRAPWLLAIYWPLLALATHWPRMDLGPPTTIADVGTDKLLHFSCFVFLSLLLFYVRPLGRRAGEGWQLLAATLIAATYAVVDELTQALIPGREFGFSDVAAGLAGVAAVVAAHAGMLRRRFGPWLAMWLCRWALLAVMPPLLLALLRPNREVWPYVFGFLRLPGVHEIWLDNRRWVLGYGIDKVGHAVVLFLLTLMMLVGRPFSRRRPVVSGLIALLLLTASGPAIEWAQAHSGFDRGFEWDDVRAHLIGVAAGAGVYGLWLALRALSRRAWTLARTAAHAARGKPAAVTDGDREASEGFVGHAAIVSALTILSRLTGLVRDAVIASGFGMGRVADAFYMAFQIPNLFRRLFGEGALSAAFIPQYSRLLHEDPKVARRLASLCTALLACVLAVITLLGEASLWAISAWTPISADTALLLRLTMLMLPYMPLICLVALLGGMLQVHRSFGPPAAAPIVLNVTLVIFASLATAGLLTDAALGQAAQIVAIGVLVAGILQLLWQIAALDRFEVFAVGFRGAGPAMRKLLWMMLPMLIGLAVFQINAFLDSVIAYAFAAPPDGPTHFTIMGRSIAWPTQSGDVVALNLAQRLYQFPLGVFGIAIATAIFPALSRAAAADSALDGPYRDTLRRGLRLTLFIGLPASLGMMLVGLPLARLIFEYRQFTLDDARRVTSVLLGYSAGVWAYSLMHVLTRAYYAIEDTRTPLRVALVTMGVNFLLNLSGIWVLGVAALAWSTSISAVLQVGLLMRGLRRRVPHMVDAQVRHSALRSVALTGVMGLAAGALLWGWPPTQLSRLGSAGLLLALVVGGATVYGSGALLTGGSELRALLKLRRNRKSQSTPASPHRPR